MSHKSIKILALLLFSVSAAASTEVPSQKFDSLMARLIRESQMPVKGKPAIEKQKKTAKSPSSQTVN